jgi:hypothetical protein
VPQFEGTVPSAILTMSSVTTIDISDNLLGGALPTTLGAFLRFLNIGGNAFSELPEITYAERRSSERRMGEAAKRVRPQAPEEGAPGLANTRKALLLLSPGSSALGRPA